MTKPRISTAGALLLGLIILGLLARLVGIGWGLPFVYHVDEQGFGKFTIRYFTGDLNPHFFEVPSLYTYMTAAVWEGYYIGGKIAGSIGGHADFIKAYRRNPTVFVLLGRLLTVLLSVGTIVLVFLLGRKMYGLRAGALAGLLLVFSLEHVKQSHVSIPDVTMVFFLMVSFLFIWAIYTTGKTWSYILAGLFAGLAYATKYGGHFMAIPLLLAHFFRAAERKEPFLRSLFSPKLAAALLSFIGGFLLGCPYSVLDSPKFLKDFRRQTKHLFIAGHFGSSTAEPSWLFYLKYGFRDNIGRLAQFLVPAGVILGLVKHRKKDILLLSVPVVVFATMAPMKSYATRYLMPIAGLFVLIAAMFLDQALTWIAAELRKLRRPTVPSWAVTALLAAVVLVVLLPSVAQVARYDDSVSRTDTRTVAKAWVESHIPKGERFSSEEYGPPLDPKDYRFFNRRTLGQIDLDWLAQRQVKYVLISDIMYSRFLEAPLEFPREASFYRSLDEKAYLLKTFAPRWDEDLKDLHNPTVKLYRLSAAPNYSFPGAFRQYVHSVRIAAAAGGSWVVRTAVEGREPRPSDERPGRAYIRFVNAAGLETWRASIGRDPLPSDRDFRLTAELPCPAQAEAISIYVGYESVLSTGLKDAAPSVGLDKESLLAGPIEPAVLNSQGFDSFYVYSESPQAGGAPYFQSATLIRRLEGWRLSATVFGSKLRGGTCYIVDPFVKFTDQGGKEIGRLVIFQGKVGGLDSPQKVPATASASLPHLPEDFRLFFGYGSSFDQGHAREAGGPSEVEVALIPHDR